MVAARQSGFSLRPRWYRHDPALRRFSKLAVWGVLLHSGAALLLGASLVAGNGVAGRRGRVSVAFVFFLAPYAVLAQPIQATTLPEMAIHASSEDLSVPRSTRWALDRTALLIIPVSLGLVAIALPRCASSRSGARARPGRGSSRPGSRRSRSACTPTARSCCSRAVGTRSATVALLRSSRSAPRLFGVAIMLVGSRFTHGRRGSRSSASGTAAAYLVGAIILGIGCARRPGQSIMPRLLPISCAIAGVIAFVSWLALRALDPSGRPTTVACLAVVGAIGTGAVRPGGAALVAHAPTLSTGSI